jgi:raffinose/stachyose/melibiose transport system substrate-binding protein
MRKITLYVFAIISILAMIVSFSLTGCKTNATAETEATVAETVAEETSAVAETNAAAEATSGEPVKLVWWNWGEEESPGWDAYCNETVELYMKDHPNVTIEVVPQTAANLYEAFGAANAAKSGPDIQNGWDGIWSVMWVWDGGAEPVSDYFSQEVMDRILMKQQFMTEGKMWAVPLYMVSTNFWYNKKLFKQAGLDPDKPPATWDEFLSACQKLKDAGITPITAGNLEGMTTVDYSSYFLDDYANKRTDFMKVYVDPNEDYASAKYLEGWKKFRELTDKEYFNKDVASTRYYQGWEKFLSGESAMACLMSGYTKKIIEAIGEENVGVFPYFPISGTGSFSTKIPGGAQDLWITPWSKYKQEAADFIAYLISPERSKAMYEKSHVLPANTAFDPSVLETDTEKFVYANLKDNSKPMYSGFVPGYILEQGITAAAQEIFLPGKTAEDVAAKYKELIPQIETQTPAGFEGYKKWYESYLAIGE